MVFMCARLPGKVPSQSQLQLGLQIIAPGVMICSAAACACPIAVLQSRHVLDAHPACCDVQLRPLPLVPHSDSM